MNTTAAECTRMYRSHLAAWGIRPAFTIAAAFEGMSRSQLHEWERLLERGIEDERLYDWMNTRRRLGAAHSQKWTEILTSGVWACLMLTEHQAGNTSRVLDLGSNAGYWTTFASAYLKRPVVGIDKCATAIHLGMERIRSTGLSGELLLGDYRELGVHGPFDAIVSNQGLSRSLRESDFSQLASVVEALAGGGILVLIEPYFTHESVGEIDSEMKRLGLRVITGGVAGGLCCENRWESYVCVVLEKSSSHGPSIQMAVDACVNIWEEEFRGWVNLRRETDWTERNLAYYWAAGGSVRRDLRNIRG